MKKTSIKINVIANYIGQFYIMFIGLITLPLYLKLLGAEAYGLIGFYVSLQFWMIFLDMGLSSTFSRETSKLRISEEGLLNLKHLLRSIEFYFFVTSFFLIIGAFLLSGWISTHWLNVSEVPPGIVENSIKAMSIGLVFRWFFSLYKSGITAYEHQVWVNVLVVIVNSIRFIGGLVFIRFVSCDIFHYFLFQILVGGVEFWFVRNKMYRLLPKTYFLTPSLAHLKKIGPFALSIAYTSEIWIIFTQFDKLILSHYLPLREYGYFSMIAMISYAIMSLSGPIKTAVLPRMVSLLSNGKESEMLELYHKSIQYATIVVFSFVGLMSFFSYEFLLAWTDNIEAAKWGSGVLIWYLLGNGLLALIAFQYYLQYAYGNLKYHVGINTFFPIVVLPIMFFAVRLYGATGTGIAWFGIHLILFFSWSPFIHHKFAPGSQKRWLLKDLLPAMLSTVIFLFILGLLDIPFMNYNRIAVLCILISLGLVLLVLNSFMYKNVRDLVRDYLSSLKLLKI